MNGHDVYRALKRHLATRTELERHGYPLGISGFTRICGTTWNPGVIGLDCEMCTSMDGNGEYFQEVIRISIVDHRNTILYDTYVRPHYPVITYHTDLHGITRAQAQGGVSLSEVHGYLRRNFFSNTIIVGHSLEHDFRALLFEHSFVVDVSLLHTRPDGRKYSLRDLTQMYLNRILPDHDSVEDARAAMDLARIL